MKGDGSQTRTRNPNSAPTETEGNASVPLRLDYEQYRGHITDPGITDEQAQALMQEVWKLMIVMVDIGFGEDATNIVLSSFKNALRTEFEGCSRESELAKRNDPMVSIGNTKKDL